MRGTWQTEDSGGWLMPVACVVGGLLALRALAAAAAAVGAAVGALIVTLLWVAGSLLIAAMVGVPTFLILRRRYRRAHPVAEIRRPPWRAERVEAERRALPSGEARPVAPPVTVNLHLYPGTDPGLAAEVLARAGVELPRGDDARDRGGSAPGGHRPPSGSVP